MTGNPVAHVIDEDAALRRSLAVLLNKNGVEAVGYPSVESFLAASPVGQGCIISDLCVPNTVRFLLESLKEKSQGLPIIVMSAEGNIPIAVEAMRLGAQDFIEKPFSDSVILQAVISALSGDANTTGSPEVLAAKHKMALLSTREREVLDGLLLGQSNKIIGHNLGISPRTVEIYRAHLMAKTKSDSLSMLLRTALMAER
jgi:two-component system response regulator FixJ